MSVNAKGGSEAGDGSFADMMDADEAARYDAYWKQGAGSYKNITENGTKKEIIISSGDTINTRQRLQTSPGTRSIVDVKYGKNNEMYYILIHTIILIHH